MTATSTDRSSGEQAERVRRLCLALPATSERLSHGEPTFFVGRRVFVMFADNHHGDGRVAVWLPAPPGVQSALYDQLFSGLPKDDLRNNARLLENLAKEADRRAHYVCVLVLLRTAKDPQPVIAEGEWHGEILSAPRGDGGFGYDPLFYVAQLGQSAAEIPAQMKNVLSHRAIAFGKLAARLQEGDLFR